MRELQILPHHCKFINKLREDLSNLSDKFVEDETLSKDNFNEEMNINRKEDQVAVLTQSNENNENTSNNKIEALLEEENLEIRETDNNFKKETKHVVEIIDNEEIVKALENKKYDYDNIVELFNAYNKTASN